MLHGCNVTDWRETVLRLGLAAAYWLSAPLLAGGTPAPQTAELDGPKLLLQEGHETTDALSKPPVVGECLLLAWKAWLQGVEESWVAKSRLGVWMASLKPRADLW